MVSGRRAFWKSECDHAKSELLAGERICTRYCF